MGRYVRLVWLQLRASALLTAQYRWDFLLDGAVSLVWASTAIAPLLVVYQDGRPGIPGWSFGEALVVVGWFILLQGVLEGAINPSLQSVVEHIRKGTLDFVLMKPADAQFLVSTSRFLVWRVVSVIFALSVMVYAFVSMGRWPWLPGVAMSLVLLVAATVILYSLWILTVSVAFRVVKVDNLTNFFTSVFDAARWPRAVYRGAMGFVFTFVVPLSLMTSYPAEALLGRLELATLGWAVLGSAAFAFVARQVWLGSLRLYTSASS